MNFEEFTAAELEKHRHKLTDEDLEMARKTVSGFY